jgi:acid phosphatase type 7
MRRLALISAVASMTLAGGVVSSSAAPQLPPPRAVASADAYVTAAARKRNFGGSRVLRVGARPATRAYLRFTLKGISGATVTKATLRLYSLSSRGRFSVQLTSSKWTERTITFRNAPRPRRRIAWPVVARRGLVGIDVTNAVSAGKMASFAITAPRGLVRLASRESGSRAPRIDFGLETPETLIAAGDIADCGSTGDEATAALVDQLPGTVAALGDLAYPDGSLTNFSNCYQPSWGRFKARTRPAPGNHEYRTAGASGYFSYWGAVAGNPAQGWYSYDLGAWHVVSLNSNCPLVGGCGVGSPQETWLRADLAAHGAKCTAAYWHHPRFSGGQVTNEDDMMPLWQALYDAKADVVLSGHAHNYQRFAPQNALGVADAARGIREFVVGTGGEEFDPVGAIANTQVANDTAFGVLELTLHSRSYDWQFHPVAGQTFTDSGSQACH